MFPTPKVSTWHLVISIPPSAPTYWLHKCRTLFRNMCGGFVALSREPELHQVVADLLEETELLGIPLSHEPQALPFLLGSSSSLSHSPLFFSFAATIPFPIPQKGSGPCSNIPAPFLASLSGVLVPFKKVLEEIQSITQRAEHIQSVNPFPYQFKIHLFKLRGLNYYLAVGQNSNVMSATVSFDIE